MQHESHIRKAIVTLMLISAFGYMKAGLALEVPQASALDAPGFELLDMRGDKHQLSGYEGKTVIVNFWAVWCAPCRKEIPAMNRAMDVLKKENISLLAINVGDGDEAIKAFSKMYPMDFPVLKDDDGVVSQNWRVAAFPTTFIINTDGKIVSRIVGPREWDQEDMLDNVRTIAGVKPKF